MYERVVYTPDGWVPSHAPALPGLSALRYIGPPTVTPGDGEREREGWSGVRTPRRPAPTADRPRRFGGAR